MSRRASLKKSEEPLEVRVKSRIEHRKKLHYGTVLPLEKQAMRHAGNVPPGEQDGQDLSSLKPVGDDHVPVRARLDGIELGSIELGKDITNFEIGRTQKNPRFVDFRKMPVPILQCFFWPDAWKIFCTCIFLNCTRRVQVERVVWKFFETYPTPEALLAAADEEIQEIIRPLGFYKRRTTSLKRMSEDFIAGNWKSPEDLRSVGVYAATCYKMMFNFELGEHAPDDHALVDLYNWMKGISPRREIYLGESVDPSRMGRLLPDVRR